MQQQVLLRAIASGFLGSSASVLGTGRKLSLIPGSVGRSACSLHSRCLLGVETSMQSLSEMHRSLLTFPTRLLIHVAD